MGTMTLADFRSELIFDLRNRTDTTDPLGFSTTRQDRYINAGYLHVAHPSVFRHQELQVRVNLSLISGTQGYTFTPTGGLTSMNIVALRSAAYVQAATDDPTATRTKLFPHDEQWFQDRSVNSGGPPRDYYVRANQVFLSPVPGANEAGNLVVLTAVREPARLSLGGDLTVLPSTWDEIVSLAARWRAEFHLGYRDLAEASKLDLNALINEYGNFEALHGEDWDWMSEVRTDSYMETV